MDENFKKCKKKLMREFILKVSLLALAAGLTISGLIIGLTKLLKLNFPYYYSIVIGVLLAIGLFFLIYKLKKPTDEKIAERVDSDFKLQEKVTSMVAFQDREGLLYEKQREDAKEQLAKKDTKKLPVRLAVINIPALVFGASLFTASFFTPAISSKSPSEKVPTKDDFNEKTDEIAKEIHDIIDNSKASKELKEELSRILDELVENLEDDTDVYSRYQKVTAAKAEVDAALDKVNTKEEIGGAMEASEDDYLAELGKAIKEGNKANAVNALESIEKQLNASKRTDTVLVDYLYALAGSIETALKASTISSSDALYKAVHNLQVSASGLSEKYQNYLDGLSNGIDEAQTKADGTVAIEAAIEEISECLDAQEENTELADAVKEYMDALVNPTNSGSGDGSDGEDQSGQSGESGQQGNGGEGESGDSGSDGDGDGDGDDGKDSSSDGSGDGDGSDSSQSGEDGSGKTSNAGDDSDSSQSGGASGGDGKTQYGGEGNVYTEDDGYTTYHDVIDESKSNADADSEKYGDSEIDDILGDYFGSLYGSGDNDSNP